MIRILSAVLLLFSSSCAMMFNDKEVDVVIASSPPGANIIIEGRNYGRTPTTIKLEPKNYNVTLAKQGYGSTELKMESWAAFRKGTGDKTRCIMDVLLMPLYVLGVSNVCSDFKKPEYFATIPYVGVGGGMMGIDNGNNSSSPSNGNPYMNNNQSQQRSGYVPRSQGNYYGSGNGGGYNVQVTPQDRLF